MVLCKYYPCYTVYKSELMDVEEQAKAELRAEWRSPDGQSHLRDRETKGPHTRKVQKTITDFIITMSIYYLFIFPWCAQETR